MKILLIVAVLATGCVNHHKKVIGTPVLFGSVQPGEYYNYFYNLSYRAGFCKEILLAKKKWGVDSATKTHDVVIQNDGKIIAEISCKPDGSQIVTGDAKAALLLIVHYENERLRWSK